MNSLENDELKRIDREIVWHAFTQMQEYVPFIIQNADGCVLTDIDGQQYLDAVSSMWCNLHGHRHPKIDTAIRKQLDQVAHVTNLGMSNPTTIELAKRLIEITPQGLNHVFFSDSGATSIEVAIKMAFQYWQQCETPRTTKTTYIALETAYHGDTIGSSSVGGIARFHQIFHPLLFDVIRVPRPETYRLPHGLTSESACSFFLEQLEQTLIHHHHQVAALILEPLVQCAAGMVMHPEGYLKGVREITSRYDVLLIADEVAVGMGRTGMMFACEQEKVSPDIMCLAKGITGGYLPMAATLASTTIWDAFLGDYAESKSFFHGHTYGGNPLGAAAALASLEIFDQEQTLAKLPTKIIQIADHMGRIAHHPNVGDVRQRGMIAAIELVRDKTTQEPFPWEEKRGIQICEFARQNGVFVRPLGNVIVIMPPLSVSADEIDIIMSTIEQGIHETLGA